LTRKLIFNDAESFHFIPKSTSQVNPPQPLVFYIDERSEERWVLPKQKLDTLVSAST